MTVLSAANSAAIRVNVGSLPALFPSTDHIAVEFRDLIQEVAEDIAEAAEWRDLIKTATLTGGSSFPKPADFDRMLKGQGVQDATNWFWGYHPFSDVSEYIAAVNGAMPLISPGGWIILDGEFKFWPAAVGTATFPYVSNLIVRSSGGTLKPAFTADDDTFVLDERLLTLGLIWRYRAQKGVDYSEDMANYEMALAQAMDRDKGARMLRPDHRWRVPGARLAYVNRGFGGV